MTYSLPLSYWSPGSHIWLQAIRQRQFIYPHGLGLKESLWQKPFEKVTNWLFSFFILRMSDRYLFENMYSLSISLYSENFRLISLWGCMQTIVLPILRKFYWSLSEICITLWFMRCWRNSLCVSIMTNISLSLWDNAEGSLSLCFLKMYDWYRIVMMIGYSFIFTYFEKGWLLSFWNKVAPIPLSYSLWSLKIFNNFPLI